LKSPLISFLLKNNFLLKFLIFGFAIGIAAINFDIIRQGFNTDELIKIGLKAQGSIKSFELKHRTEITTSPSGKSSPSNLANENSKIALFHLK